MSDTRYEDKQRRAQKSKKGRTASNKIGRTLTQFKNPRATLLKYVNEAFFDNHIILQRNSTFVIGTRPHVEKSTGILCDDAAISHLTSMVVKDRAAAVPMGVNQRSRKQFQFLEWDKTTNPPQFSKFMGNLEYALENVPPDGIRICHLERAIEITSRADANVPKDDYEDSGAETESDDDG
jgi:hypothetical protein